MLSSSALPLGRERSSTHAGHEVSSEQVFSWLLSAAQAGSRPSARWRARALGPCVLRPGSSRRPLRVFGLIWPGWCPEGVSVPRAAVADVKDDRPQSFHGGSPAAECGEGDGEDQGERENGDGHHDGPEHVTDRCCDEGSRARDVPGHLHSPVPVSLRAIWAREPGTRDGSIRPLRTSAQAVLRNW
jgi:hypothetical protein